MTQTLALPAHSIAPDTLHQLDWRVLLAALPDASVDLCLSDTPYGTTACKWDSVIDLAHWWREMARVMKEDGAVVMTASQPYTSVLVMSNLEWFRYEWIWNKSNGGGYLNANRAPLKRHENVLVFSREMAQYYPQWENGKPYRATRGAAGGHVFDQTVAGWVTVNNGQRYPTTVQYFVNDTGDHPTQKPVALFEYLIRTYTQPDALVFDPFVGSGTTALAARNTGRHYIVGDVSPEYVQVARRRLSLPYTLPMFEGVAA